MAFPPRVLRSRSVWIVVERDTLVRRGASLEHHIGEINPVNRQPGRWRRRPRQLQNRREDVIGRSERVSLRARFDASRPPSDTP